MQEEAISLMVMLKFFQIISSNQNVLLFNSLQVVSVLGVDIKPHFKAKSIPLKVEAEAKQTVEEAIDPDEILCEHATFSAVEDIHQFGMYYIFLVILLN